MCEKSVIVARSNIKDDRYSFHFKVLACMGLWDYKFKSVFYQKLFYTYRCFFFFITILSISLALIELYEVRHDLKQISFNLSTTLFGFLIVLKNLILSYESRQINALRSTLYKHSLSHMEECHQEIKEHFWKLFLVGKKSFYYSSLIFFPLWLGASLYTLKEGPREMPFSIWLPLNLELNKHFAIGFAFHAFVGGFVTLEAMHSELAVIGIGIQLVTQIKILACDIARIATAENLTTSRFEAAATEVKIKEFFKTFVQRHLQIIKHVKEVEVLFGGTSLLGLVVVVVLLVVNGAQILQYLYSGSKVKWYYQSGYTVMIMTDVFFSCWVGTLLAEEQEKLALTLYGIPWYEMNHKLQKDFLFMLVGAQVDRSFVLFKTFKGDLSMFLRVVKIVSSWLAVLWQFMLSSN